MPATSINTFQRVNTPWSVFATLGRVSALFSNCYLDIITRPWGSCGFLRSGHIESWCKHLWTLQSNSVISIGAKQWIMIDGPEFWFPRIRIYRRLSPGKRANTGLLRENELKAPFNYRKKHDSIIYSKNKLCWTLQARTTTCIWLGLCLASGTAVRLVGCIMMQY